MFNWLRVRLIPHGRQYSLYLMPDDERCRWIVVVGRRLMEIFVLMRICGSESF